MQETAGKYDQADDAAFEVEVLLPALLISVSIILTVIALLSDRVSVLSAGASLWSLANASLGG